MSPVAVLPKPDDLTVPTLLNTKVKQAPSDAVQRTLPAGWMRDESILELEKRAIFSKVSSVRGIYRKY